jgi:hypothetical protein
MQGIPTAFLRQCELCGNDLDNRAEGVHQWTGGWVMNRKAGGGNAISCPERQDRWAHKHCVERLTYGQQHRLRL